MEVFNSQKFENDSSASGNLDGRDHSDNIATLVTVPEETNDQVEESEDEGRSGDVCCLPSVKSKVNM